MKSEAFDGSENEKLPTSITVNFCSSAHRQGHTDTAKCAASRKATMASNESPSYTLLMNSEFDCDEWELNEAWGLVEQSSRGSSPLLKSPLHESQPQNLEAVELDHMYYRKDRETLMECQPVSLDRPTSLRTLLRPSGPEPMDEPLYNPVKGISLLGSLTGLVPLHTDLGPMETDSDHHENSSNEAECSEELKNPGTAINHVGSPLGSVSSTGSVNSLHMNLDFVEPSSDQNCHKSNSEKNQQSGGEPTGMEGETCFSVQDQSISDDLSVSGESEYHLKHLQTKESGKVQDRMVVQMDHSYSRGSALCEICGSLFADQLALEKHATEHNILERSDISPPHMYKCPFCDYIAKNKTSFRNHQNLHILGSDLTCVWCDTLFLQPETLKQHKCELKHVNRQEEMVGTRQPRQSNDGILQMSQQTCTYCDYIATYRRSVEKHRNLHAESLEQEQNSMGFDPYAGPQPYLCECCGSSFIQEHAFNVHMTMHRYMDTESSGHLPVRKSCNMDDSIPETIKCHICHKEFKSRTKLLCHKRLYRGETCRPVKKRKKTDGGINDNESAAKMPRSEQQGSIGQQELGWKFQIYGTDGEPISGRKGKSPKEGPISAPKCKWAIKSLFEACNCSLCGKGFPCAANLKVHIKKKHSGFYCNKCNVLAFSTEEEWNNHLLNTHGEQYKSLELKEKGPKLPSVKKPESSPAKELQAFEGRPAKELKSVESGESYEINTKSSSRPKDPNHLQSGQTQVRAVNALESSTANQLQAVEGTCRPAKELRSLESGESNEVNAKSSSRLKDPNHLQIGQRLLRAKFSLAKQLQSLEKRIAKEINKSPSANEPKCDESRESRKRNAKSSKIKDPNHLQSGQTDVRAPVRKISTVVDTRFHCNLCGDKFFSDPTALKIHIRHKHSGFFCDRCNVIGFSSRKEYMKHICEAHNAKSESVVLKKDGPKPSAPGGKTKSLLAKEPKSVKSDRPEGKNKLSNITKATTTEPTKVVQSNVSTVNTKSVIKKQQKSVQSENKRDTGRQAKRNEKAASVKEPKSVESEESNERYGKSPSTTKDPNHLRSAQENVSAQAHMISTVRDKRVYCDVCDKEFSRPNKLKKHMEIHASQGNFSCDKCHRLSFQSSAELKEHMKSHSDQVAYICDVCSFAFGSQKSLDKHKSRYHL